MTFQNSHVRFYVSLIGSGEGRHTTHLLKCVLLLSTSQTDWKQSSDILSHILSDSLSDILSDISFDILSDTSSDISSDILSDISFDILSGISSDILSDISFHILSDISSDILSDLLILQTLAISHTPTPALIATFVVGKAIGPSGRIQENDMTAYICIMCDNFCQTCHVGSPPWMSNMVWVGGCHVRTSLGHPWFTHPPTN